MDVAGIGVGARSKAEREMLNRDGDAEACAIATSDDEQPPDGCGALLRVEVTPLGAAKSTPVVTAEAGDEPAPNRAIAIVAPPQSGDSIPPGPGIVKIHIDSPDPGVQLYGTDVAKLVEQPDGNFRSVGPSTILCRAPCDEYLDVRTGQQLHLASPDMPPSNPFLLFANRGEVNLRVEPGDSALYTIGGWSSAIGVLGVLAGGAVLLVGGMSASSETDQSRTDALYLGGGVALGAGALVLGDGIALTMSGSTDIEITPPPGDITALPLGQ